MNECKLLKEGSSEGIEKFFIERFGLEYPDSCFKHIKTIYDDHINSHYKVNQLLGLNSNNGFRRSVEINTVDEDTMLYNILYELGKLVEIDYEKKTINKMKFAKFFKKAFKSNDTLSEMVTSLLLNTLFRDYKEEFKEINEETKNNIIDKFIASEIQKTFMKETLIISTNPTDFLYSSNCYCSYTSCFAPEGQYSSSSVAYMRSSNTLIAYTSTHCDIKNNALGENAILPHKNSRVWCYLSENGCSFYIGRGYNMTELIFKEVRKAIYKFLGKENMNWCIKRDVKPNTNVPVATTDMERCYMDTHFIYVHLKGIDTEPFYFKIQQCLCPYCGDLTDYVWNMNKCCSYENVYCSMCGTLLSEEEINNNSIDYVVFNRNDYYAICDECLNEYFTRCSNCGMYHHVDYVYYVEDISDYVCDDCIDSGNYFICEHCGYVYTTEYQYTYKDKDVCFYCYEDFMEREKEENEDIEENMEIAENS